MPPPRDRQDAIFGWLRSRRVTTIAELADRFGISVRTAHRDIAALRDRGIDVGADAGRGGGIRLDPLQALPPVVLEIEDVLGLALSMGLARYVSAQPFGAAARRALQKIVAGLPSDRVAELRRALDRVMVASPASDAVRTSLGGLPDDVVLAFERAFTARRTLGFEYVDRNGSSSSRRVEPHGLLLHAPAWYLLAHDLDREAGRMFRLDRMSSPTLLADEFVPCPLAVFEPLLVDFDATALGIGEQMLPVSAV